jgi:hypothetical protein
VAELEQLFEKYGKQVDFKLVYVREAHPSDGWALPVNERQGIEFTEPKTDNERAKVAHACVKDLKISIPTVLDGLDNAVEKAYAGWPDRIYVIAKDGTIAYKGAPGPRGFVPAEAEKAVRKLLG